MRKLNQQDEMRMARLEAELEELKKAVHELQLKDGKTVRISPSTTWGKFIHKTDEAIHDRRGDVR